MGDTFQDHWYLKPWIVQHPSGTVTITVDTECQSYNSFLCFSTSLDHYSYVLRPLVGQRGSPGHKMWRHNSHSNNWEGCLLRVGHATDSVWILFTEGQFISQAKWKRASWISPNYSEQWRTYNLWITYFCDSPYTISDCCWILVTEIVESKTMSEEKLGRCGGMECVCSGLQLS